MEWLSWLERQVVLGFYLRVEWKFLVRVFCVCFVGCLGEIYVASVVSVWYALCEMGVCWFGAEMFIEG